MSIKSVSIKSAMYKKCQYKKCNYKKCSLSKVWSSSLILAPMFLIRIDLKIVKMKRFFLVEH